MDHDVDVLGPVLVKSLARCVPVESPLLLPLLLLLRRLLISRECVRARR